MGHKRRSRLNRQKESEREVKSPLWRRRKFLAASAVTVGALATGTWFGVKEMLKKSQAEEFLENFPLKMPGAVMVEKFEVKGAEHCLVHIRTMHKNSHTTMVEQAKQYVFEELNPKDSREKEKLLEIFFEKLIRMSEVKAKIISQDLDKILEFLVTKNYPIEQIYIEGLSVKKEIELAETFDVLGRAEVAMEEMQRAIATTTDPQIKKGVQERLSRMQSLQNESLERLDLSALDIPILKHAVKGGLRIRGAEMAQIHKAVLTATGKEEHDLKQKEREDALLQIISKNDHAIAVTVFGGSHDWTDNVKNWNRTNKNKFNYIRITPAAYPKLKELGEQLEKKIRSGQKDS